MPKTNVEKFDQQVTRYEIKRNCKIDFQEQRGQLLQNVSGDVLEVAVGAGHNFAYYKNVTSFTAIDFSEKMLESAKKKWNELHDEPAVFLHG